MFESFFGLSLLIKKKKADSRVKPPIVGGLQASGSTRCVTSRAHHSCELTPTQCCQTPQAFLTLDVMEYSGPASIINAEVDIALNDDDSSKKN